MSAHFNLTLYAILAPLKYNLFENIMETKGASATFSIIFSKAFKNDVTILK